MPKRDWQRFVVDGVFTTARIRQFANEQGVAPGILVGRLQNQGILPWNNRLNSLKVRLNWVDK